MTSYWYRSEFEKCFLNDESDNIYHINFKDIDGTLKNGFIIKIVKSDATGLQFNLLCDTELEMQSYIKFNILISRIQEQLYTKYESLLNKNKFFYSKIPLEFEVIKSYKEYFDSTNIEKLFKHLNLKLIKHEEEEK